MNLAAKIPLQLKRVGFPVRLGSWPRLTYTLPYNPRNGSREIEHKDALTNPADRPPQPAAPPKRLPPCVVEMAVSGRYVAATGALMACAHCGGLRRVRMDGEFVSCDSCGKVLQQRGRKQRAVEAEARRRRRWLGARKRRDGRAAAGGGGMFVGRDASDAESDTGCVCSVESAS